MDETTPKATPDVSFTYDAAGNRTLMSESDGVDTIRNTRYTFDQARRVGAVEFDTNGDGTYEQTVSYTYNLGGLRTELRLPDNQTLTYTYDARGQLVSLTDWDDQTACYAYDQSGRLVAVERPNGMHSRYTYDAASRLRQLRHTVNNHVLGHFAYEVDARGNRTQAVEMLLGTGTGPQTILSDDSQVDYYQGAWSPSGLFMQTTEPGAKLRLLFFGKQATLTLGTGVDHGICDIYVNNSLWRSIDSYATSTGEDSTIVLNLASEGSHWLEIRNTADKHPHATGRTLRFKQLAISSGPLYDLHTIQYALDDTTPGYDALGRVLGAKYRRGGRTSGMTFREYALMYDVAGNRTLQVASVNGTPTITSCSYDEANRLSQVGTQAIAYDAAGRLTDDGTLTYAWDRASRLLSAGGSSYTYNGTGQRLTQTVGANMTQYLLDTQSGLYKVLTATTGAAVDRFVHGPTGIQAQQDSSNNWEWMLQDGLGSVRSVLDDSLGVLQMSHYAPYGEPWGEQGTTQTLFGFTGEPTDQNNLVQLRARYYNPSLGVFQSRDFLELTNRYAYVGNNPINLTDPTGLIGETPERKCEPSQNGNQYPFCSYGNGSVPMPSDYNGGLYNPFLVSTSGVYGYGKYKVYLCPSQELVELDIYVPNSYERNDHLSPWTKRNLYETAIIRGEVNLENLRTYASRQYYMPAVPRLWVPAYIWSARYPNPSVHFLPRERYITWAQAFNRLTDLAGIDAPDSVEEVEARFPAIGQNGMIFNDKLNKNSTLNAVDAVLAIFELAIKWGTAHAMGNQLKIMEEAFEYHRKSMDSLRVVEIEERPLSNEPPQGLYQSGQSQYRVILRNQQFYTDIAAMPIGDGNEPPIYHYLLELFWTKDGLTPISDRKEGYKPDLVGIDYELAGYAFQP